MAAPAALTVKEALAPAMTASDCGWVTMEGGPDIASDKSGMPLVLESFVSVISMTQFTASAQEVSTMPSARVALPTYLGPARLRIKPPRMVLVTRSPLLTENGGKTI